MFHSGTFCELHIHFVYWQKVSWCLTHTAVTFTMFPLVTSVIVSQLFSKSLKLSLSPAEHTPFTVCNCEITIKPTIDYNFVAIMKQYI